MRKKTDADRLINRWNQYLFLDRLRESGKINMFGAVPYLEQAFKLSRKEATEVLMDWMNGHQEEE